jgi:putative pyrimidine permease RutG
MIRPMSGPRAWLPSWTLSAGGVVAPDERLPAVPTLALGLQHVVAMFGATVLAPLLMGFDPNVAILFSGVGTLIFFVAVGGRVPSYLGSSFAFISVVIAATAYPGHGPNSNLGRALGGIVAAGAVYALIGAAVMRSGYRWIERLMPPVVTGAVVAIIGLNLAPIGVKGIAGSTVDAWIGIVTILVVGLVAVRAPGLARRLPILLGGLAGYVLYALAANGLGLATPIDFTAVARAPWIGLPTLTAPEWDARAVTLIAPVAIVLVAENLGHVKAVAAMTGRNLDSYLGRAFLGDGLATMVAGAGGGTGVTTYAENIGVMAVTKIYSTLIFLVAAGAAIVLGFSPKFGALIMTIPEPVLGGLSIVVFGLITATGGRIWVENRVDFSRARNLVTAAVTLTVGAGDLALRFGGFTLGGIGTATFGAILLYHLFRDDTPGSDPGASR